VNWTLLSIQNQRLYTSTLLKELLGILMNTTETVLNTLKEEKKQLEGKEMSICYLWAMNSCGEEMATSDTKVQIT
jgi:hypothetical protein